MHGKCRSCLANGYTQKGYVKADGQTAYHSVCNLYSTVAGVSASQEMNPAVKSDRHRTLSEIASHFEQWTASVESFVKQGEAHSLLLPFRITPSNHDSHR